MEAEVIGDPGRRHRRLWMHLRTAMRLFLRRPVVGVVFIPILPDGRIVLVRRVDSGLFSAPGGIMDWRKTVAETAERELKEEVGLQLTRVQRMVGVYSSPARDPRMHAVTITLAVEARGELETGDPLEVSEIRAFEPHEIPFGQLDFDHDEQLRDYFAGQTVLR